MINFKQLHSPDGPVVELVGAYLPPMLEYDVAMENVSLTLRQGELAIILLEHGSWSHPVADVLSGLVALERGTVRVFGGEWAGWGPDVQAMARGRIGRVFEGQGWMSNLDIDENVTLSERHHTSRSIEDIDEEMKRLSRLAGLQELPQGRPSLADHEELRRAEWVRAALGSPWLVLLERPGRDLADGWIKDIVPLQNHLRSLGTAIVWLAEDEMEMGVEKLNPTLKLLAKENTLIDIGDR